MAKDAKKSGKPGPFGRNVLARRKERGWTQDHLAELTQISKSYISSLEGGSRDNPSEALARKFAAAFRCDVSDLWGRSQSDFEARAMVLLRQMPEDRREAAIAALSGLAALPPATGKARAA